MDKHEAQEDNKYDMAKKVISSILIPAAGAVAINLADVNKSEAMPADATEQAYVVKQLNVGDYDVGVHITTSKMTHECFRNELGMDKNTYNEFAEQQKALGMVIKLDQMDY